MYDLWLVPCLFFGLAESFKVIFEIGHETEAGREKKSGTLCMAASQQQLRTGNHANKKHGQCEQFYYNTSVSLSVYTQVNSNPSIDIKSRCALLCIIITGSSVIFIYTALSKQDSYRLTRIPVNLDDYRDSRKLIKTPHRGDFAQFRSLTETPATSIAKRNRAERKAIKSNPRKTGLGIKGWTRLTDCRLNKYWRWTRSCRADIMVRKWLVTCDLQARCPRAVLNGPGLTNGSVYFWVLFLDQL